MLEKEKMREDSKDKELEEYKIPNWIIQLESLIQKAENKDSKEVSV